ncbi:hypothetical protein LCGC14_2520800 [marine sediment metagenome]|uniref:ABC transporter domain-containing protein n=1 Tax=marine sediment metagenome TaxID=412755 RepID=A0A0F9D806_9ZZZZ
MLKVKNLESGYGNLRVLRHVSLHVNPGEIVTIIGANGAGKTTLLHTIAGLLKARGGEVVFGGEDITRIPVERRGVLGCSLVPEGRQLFADMTVNENLMLISNLGRFGNVGENMYDIGKITVVVDNRSSML